MSEHIKFTEQEQAEIETLTLTKKIARGAKGALTAKQLAEMLNISPKTVFKMAKAGRIPSFRIGTAVRFDTRISRRPMNGSTRPWPQEKPRPKRVPNLRHPICNEDMDRAESAIDGNSHSHVSVTAWNLSVVRLRARRAAVGSGAESFHGSLPQRRFVAIRSKYGLR